MYEGKYLLTPENYEACLEAELTLYTTFDFASLNDQEDYADDRYAAFDLVVRTGALAGRDVLADPSAIRLSHAELAEDQYEGKTGVICEGRLDRESRSEVSVSDYLRDTDYIGFRLEIDDIGPAQFLFFEGKKLADHGQPTVCVYNEAGEAVREFTLRYKVLDNEWHTYYLDIADLTGKATVIFHGGYIDSTGRADSAYVFSDVQLYEKTGPLPEPAP